MADLMRRLCCPDCGRYFMVDEDDLEDSVLICPHCEAEVPADDEQ